MKDLNFRKGDAKSEVYGTNAMINPAPVDKIPAGPTTSEVAYQMVKDETFPQTQPRLNLATFVTTYMDEYATRLMNEANNINYIDETEYPRVAVMAEKCVNILANLWNTPEQAKWKAGAVAIGSSEACMLGGVAAWLRWRERRIAAGKPYDKPNFVISSGYQVVWEKFADLWQIEMRTVPLTLDKTTLDPAEAIKMCDENTICIVPIQGVTWTGLNDDVEALDKAIDEYNAKTGNEVCIHVDAASGGFILPFLAPEVKWDFRLKWVLSISTSGHKFGLVYPGLGWVVWKDKKYLPGKMAFSVNYLGADITQVGINFSRPAAQILGQYYQFIRLGFEGYKEIQTNSMDVTKYLHSEIAKMAPFVNYSNDIPNPLFIWYMKPEYDKTAKWTLYDLQHKLQESGWMVPAYTLPDNLENFVVMRVVCRQGMSRDMADMLLNDIRNAITEFEKLEYPTQSRLAIERNEKQKEVFNHSGVKK
ncbi:MAG: glutamate decarboxylase [Bacteroidales bacterium]